MTFAEVVFNLPLNHSFTYKIPNQFSGLTAGCRVYVPFGKRIITGLVVAVKEKSDYKNVKEIIDLLDEKPLLKPGLLKLTEWIANYYMSSWGQAVQLALPKGLDEFEKEIIHLVEELPEADLSEKQKELYHLIAYNPGKSKSYYRKKFGQTSYYSILRNLKNKGLIFSEVEKHNAQVGVLLRHYVTIPEDYVQQKENNSDFLKYLQKRPVIDEYLLNHLKQPVLVSEFLKATKMARATLQKMAHGKIVKIEQLALERKLEMTYKEENSIKKLTSEQEKAIKEILDYTKKGTYKSFLLHGVTGSGKTVVYIEILKNIIKQDKNAIILIPEIALTPQTVFRFKQAFGEKIAVFHSKMSAGQRYDAWMACYKGLVKIAIGPRSALFAPLENIGLIVVDEEHEQSYKQTESAPLYSARDVALYLGKEHQATVVLGSATPSFESYHNTQRGRHRLIEIKKRATSALLPDVHLVDMLLERRNKDSDKVFSQILLEKIAERLKRDEQVIIFQNRRGFSSFQQCVYCGFIAKCSECEVTLTYHSYDNKLKCHYCGLSLQATNKCFNCGSDELESKGIGTQQIQQELKVKFPDSTILRMDQDTTRGRNAHDEILSSFRNGKADMLIGTQMISKGLDFPNVTLVGVISADVGLAIPDFRSPERVFQLLSQVAGRSGRGDKPGEVIIQTYQINHYAIQYAKNHDFKGFYKEEIIHRETYKYPPFVRVIQIMVSSATLTEAITKAREIAVPIRKHGEFLCEVIGPAPAAISKIKNLYRWQVTLKINKKYDPAGNKTKELLQNVLAPYSKNKSSSFFLNIDVDPAFAG